MHTTIGIFDSWAEVCLGFIPWVLALIAVIGKKRNIPQMEDEKE